MRSNLSILQRNIIDALGDCDIAVKAFTRACDRTSTLNAERYALEVKQLVAFLDPALSIAARVSGAERAPDGLLKFILYRHWHRHFPSGAKP